MTHGDDTGLRVPPRLAPIEVVIVPIYADGRGARDGARGGGAHRRRSLGEWERREHERASRARRRPRRHEARRASTTSGSCAACRCASSSARAISRRTRRVLVRRDTREKKPVVARRASARTSPTLLDAHPERHAGGGARPARGATAFASAITLRPLPRDDGGRGRVRLRGLVRRPPRARRRSRKRRRRRSACFPTRSSDRPMPPTTCLKCGRACDSRGRVGEGVLTPRRSRASTARSPCEGVCARRAIAQRTVGTPAYVYSATTIRDALRAARPRRSAACRIAFTTRSRPTRTSPSCACCAS